MFYLNKKDLSLDHYIKNFIYLSEVFWGFENH